MSELVLVGFSSMARPGADSLAEFKPRKGTKDEEKMAAQVAEKRAAFMEECAEMPYVGQLKSVFIADLARQRVHEFKGPKLVHQLNATMRPILESAFPKDVFVSPARNQVVFAGFNIRSFMKMWAIESAEQKDPLPVSLWYNNADHRDITSLILPEECRCLPLSVALQRLGVAVDTGYQPGSNAAQDAAIVTEVLSAFGLL